MVKYKNTSMSKKTFYGVEFEPGGYNEVPNYINHPAMVRATEEDEVLSETTSNSSGASNSKSSSSSSSTKKSSTSASTTETASTKSDTTSTK